MNGLGGAAVPVSKVELRWRESREPITYIDAVGKGWGGARYVEPLYQWDGENEGREGWGGNESTCSPQKMLRLQCGES